MLQQMQLRPIILQEIRPSRHTGFKRGPAPAHLARLLVVEDEATLDVASLHLALQDLQIVHDVLHAKLLLQHDSINWNNFRTWVDAENTRRRWWKFNWSQVLLV